MTLLCRRYRELQNTFNSGDAFVFYLKFKDKNKKSIFIVFLITMELWIIHHAIVYSMAMRYSCVYRDVYFFIGVS